MDNQHRKITGYRELTQVEIDLMNEIKAKAREVGELCGRLATMPTQGAIEPEAATTPGAIDKRWLAIAQTDLQKGFMSLTRSVARPSFF